MRRIGKSVIYFLLALIFLVANFYPAEAKILKDGKFNQITNNVSVVATSSGFSTKTVEMILGDIIRVLLSIIGTIFVFFIFIAGQSWMRANGNEEKISQAKKRITTLVIGLIIIISAYVASSWLISWLTNSNNVNLIK